MATGTARPMPRLFIIRHGPTEWSQNGRHTGRTDIPLTDDGVKCVAVIANSLVGAGLPIDPAKIGLALISPRKRAQQTFEIVFAGVDNKPVKTITEEVREWDYGDFEGLKPAEIRALKPTWKIWKDGCPNGESVTEMEHRVDGVIERVSLNMELISLPAQIREHHKKYLAGECDHRDVLVVAHGHFNRVLISRWIRFPLSIGTHFNVEPGSVGILGYNHNNMEEPAVNALNLHRVGSREDAFGRISHNAEYCLASSAVLGSPGTSLVHTSTMSLVESQFAERVSVQDDDDAVSPSSLSVGLDPSHGELDVQHGEESITSEQSEPADTQAEVQSESGSLSVSNSIVDENAPPQEALDPELADKPVGKVSPTTTTKKGPMSVSTNTAKANGGPPTPLVKKIINSGTFGAGSVKPAPGVRSSVSGSAVVTKPATTASTLKRSSTTAPTTTPKPTVASRTSIASAPAPSRRASLAPAVKPATSAAPRPSLASSTSTRPRPSSISAKPPAEVGKARASVTSPTLSTTSAKSATATRPKAAISDAAKKPATTARATTATSRISAPGKPGAASTRSASTTKTASTKPSGSIASIKELKEKEDSKAVEALQTKLKEVEESLKGKTDSVGTLEAQLQQLQGSFQTALEDVQTKAARVGELEAATTALEGELNEAKGAYASLQAEREGDNTLQRVKDELEMAKAMSLTSATEVGTLQAQIIELEAALACTREKLNALQAVQSASLSEAAQASAIEHEALLKAQADFDAISKEADALKAAHSEALQTAEAKIAELEPKAAKVEALRSQLGGLKEEKEEAANKISELEVEVLELKEQIEELEDAQKKFQAKIASLEADLAQSGEALKQAKKVAADREAEIQVQLESLNAEHVQEVKDASERFDALQSTLRSIEERLAGALAAAEQSRQDLVSAQTVHEERVKGLEAAFTAKEAELSQRITSIQESLDNQEAIYNGKVQGVKDEHEVLLKEAFERAKREAGAAHAQELQNLRAESNATIVQIQNQNKSNFESLQGDHAADNINLELKATQDDLAKSKAALEELRKELENVKAQRDAAKASAEAVPAISSEQAEEVARLAQELAVAKDDLAAVTDMLNLTKSSLTEMSDKHQHDIEESAKDRAEEALKLAAAHDKEIKALASQKHDLLIRLSDLEGELSTAKAALSAAQTASPKPNGTPSRAPASPGVSKEELAKLHEAHTHKVYDLQAEHEQVLKVLREELQKAQEGNTQLKQEVERKNMEMRYLESDLEEIQGEVTELKERLGESDNKADAA
ncbi:hypothetical protein FA13DRAFT_1849704 [Coprinellus micaceus]|uniref:Phosphoglycerate mutase-like protein n=1 Tax=Coprinellus micaceus TaxID=71717 RepID=A0A4Y7TXW5_COPMI|nr:hypothetical protein FA13DRAFT_1849704 [Coprinellus micaceus]